jgi:cobalt-zinc-cadmium efflux system outer membrane protein
VPATLAESDVIRLVRERDPEARAADALAAEHDAAAIAAGLYPNPQLAWSREHVPGSGPLAQREDSFALTVPIDVSGRRSAQGALARSAAAEARALASRTRSDAVLEALLQFYAALASAQRVQIARAASERLDEAARVLARRFEQGTASGYERTRIELEAELGKSELRQAQARAAADRIELAVSLGMPQDALVLQGDLAPALAAEGERSTSSGAAPRSLELAGQAEAEARRAQDSAGSAWLPALAATGGLRVTHAADETDHGYVAGVAIDVPITARGQGLRTQASARARSAAARAQALARDAQRTARRASAELAAAQAELSAFALATGERVQQLERAAQSAYREGERSVLELVDSQRASLTVELRKLELALAAKRAEAALRAARGEFE